MSVATVDNMPEVSYAMEQRDKTGRLIYREASVKYPDLPSAPIPPLTEECVRIYQKKYKAWLEFCKEKLDLYDAVLEYHTARCNYCRTHRHDEIDENYRTGAATPETIKELKKETRKLRR